jgi:hypothetical protein
LGLLGGVPRRGIYDNMRTAVDRVGRGKARAVNARFRARPCENVWLGRAAAAGSAVMGLSGARRAIRG